MDAEVVIKAISTVGFPIVMCLVMFYYITLLNNKHEKEISELSETINNNTRVLTELSTLIKTLIQK